LKSTLAHITKVKKMNKLEQNNTLDADLLNFESKMMVNHYKFGVLLRREGQKSEEEMFNNIEGSSPLFEEFLVFLGDRINLQGHTGFAGGLDIKKNSTGMNSIYTRYHDIDIMFHVSTLLPFFPADPQQIERKRHIGNDIVVIIFNEATNLFDPSIMRSEYNNVYIFVKPIVEDGKCSKYSISISSKSGTPPFGPLLTSPAIYEKNQALRTFLLTKLINAERASFEAPSFAPKIKRTRKILMEDIVLRHIKK